MMLMMVMLIHEKLVRCFAGLFLCPTGARSDTECMKDYASWVLRVVVFAGAFEMASQREFALSETNIVCVFVFDCAVRSNDPRTSFFLRSAQRHFICTSGVNACAAWGCAVE